MKYSFTFAAAAALVSVAVAQDLSGIPQCAVACIQKANADSTTCGAEDFACQCEPANMAAITGAASGCVATSCTPAELAQTLEGTKNLCASLPDGGAEPTTTAGPEPTDTSVPEPTDTTVPEPTDTTVPEPTDTAVPTEGGNGAAETVYVTVCATETTPAPPVPTGTGVTPPGNGTSPTGPPSPSFTAGADKLAVGLGSVFALGLAVLAL